MSKSEPEKKRRGKRWTTEQARAVIMQWRSSGKTAVAFAAEQGFSATRLSYWTKQLEEVELAVPKFVAVPMPTSHTMVSRTTLGIELEVDGLTLRVGEHVDAQYVAKLVAALQARGERRC